MPKLNEYLGGLVSEIVSARKMADLQTVQTAKEYAEDELLKHFSVPRMKVSSVDLTVPFAHAGLAAKMSFKEFVYDEITSVAKTDYDPSDTKSDQSLRDFLSDLEMDYNKIILRSKITAAENQVKAEELGIKRSEIQAAAYDYPIKKGIFADFSKNIISFYESLGNASWNQTDFELLSLSIQNRMIKEYQNTIKEVATQTSEVVVEASQLMKIDPKYLIYAKMNITESGMEWSRYEDINGNPVQTLIPE
ncbi:hypothetical protein [Chryseobacterium sp. GP-SGM7]|uniref:hypothetical protein n=1 Tax=Chryseobacterium sp. GP-SGM7 TaxID=3411323 RepID=UPI003B93242C